MKIDPIRVQSTKNECRSTHPILETNNPKAFTLRCSLDFYRSFWLKLSEKTDTQMRLTRRPLWYLGRVPHVNRCYDIGSRRRARRSFLAQMRLFRGAAVHKPQHKPVLCIRFVTNDRRSCALCMSNATGLWLVHHYCSEFEK